MLSEWHPRWRSTPPQRPICGFCAASCRLKLQTVLLYIFNRGQVYADAFHTCSLEIVWTSWWRKKSCLVCCVWLNNRKKSKRENGVCKFKTRTRSRLCKTSLNYIWRMKETFSWLLISVTAVVLVHTASDFGLSANVHISDTMRQNDLAFKKHLKEGSVNV